MANTGRIKDGGGAEIEGLNEFLKALKSVDVKFTKELRVAALAIANGLADRIKTQARGGNRQAAMASATIKGVSDRIPTIRYGGATKVTTSRGRRVAAGAVMFGADFGARDGKNQFPRARGAGAYMWPTVRRSRSYIVGEYMDAVDRITKEAFPN